MAKQEFQLESVNYRIFNVLWWTDYRLKTRLSTVKLPVINGVDYGYESCIFHVDRRYSEVLAHYDTLEQAVQGHRELQCLYRLTPKKFVL